MWTDKFCPECGLKLAEVRSADGTIEPGHIACRNEHSWQWTVDERGESLSRPRIDIENPLRQEGKGYK